MKRQRAKVPSDTFSRGCSAQTDFITPAAFISSVLRSFMSAAPVKEHLMQSQRNPNNPQTLWIPAHDLIFGRGACGTRSKYTPHDLSLQRSTSAMPHVKRWAHARVAGEEPARSFCPPRRARIKTCQAAEKVGPITSPATAKMRGSYSQRDLSFHDICSFSFVCLSAGFLFHWAKHDISPTPS